MTLTKTQEPQATFLDTAGRSWKLTITARSARRLKNELGLDINTILNQENGVIQTLLSEITLLIDALLMLTESQRETRSITPDQFLDSLEGDTLDQATIAFLTAMANSFPKLKRRPMMILIGHLSTARDTATEALERATTTACEKMDADLSQIIGRSLTTPPGSSDSIPETTP